MNPEKNPVNSNYVIKYNNNNRENIYKFKITKLEQYLLTDKEMYLSIIFN